MGGLQQEAGAVPRERKGILSLMRILVTGGAGFIGSHVVDAYLDNGHDVIIVDDLSRGSMNNVNPRAKFYRGDILDRAFLDSVFAKEKPEVLNHHAAQMDVNRAVREPAWDATVNIIGSLNLLQAAVTYSASRIIYASTGGAIYGNPSQLPVSEETSPAPISPYGISKHTVEHYLHLFHVLYNIPYVVLRYGNVYGPRQSSKGEAGVFAIFCEQMQTGVQPVIYGDGSKLRDYVFVADIARANVAALKLGAGEVYNIASGKGTCDQDIFKLLQDLVAPHSIEPRYAPKRSGEVDQIYLDISKAQAGLEWKPMVPLSNGARMTADSFRSVLKVPASG